MDKIALQITLMSETTFGRGDGIAGLVDAEVQQDETGLPRISGRAIKGVLVNECAEILYTLGAILGAEEAGKWQKAASRLFGRPGGSVEKGEGNLFIGDAHLPPDLVAAVRYQVQLKKLAPEAVLDSLTTIRRQTAIDPESGAPREETLRSARLVQRGLVFFAPLLWLGASSEMEEAQEKALLAACTLAARRMGTQRNRGRGKVQARLVRADLDPKQFAAAGWPKETDDLTAAWFGHLRQEVAP